MHNRTKKHAYMLVCLFCVIIGMIMQDLIVSLISPEFHNAAMYIAGFVVATVQFLMQDYVHARLNYLRMQKFCESINKFIQNQKPSPWSKINEDGI